MTEKRHLSDVELNDLFAGAAGASKLASEALMARIMAEAEMVADAQSQPLFATVSQVRQGKFRRFLNGLGGWPAVAGLVTVTVAGIWIGYASPDALEDITDLYLATDTGFNLEDLMPSYDNLLNEG